MARVRLTRDRILQAALELADAEGVEALKMRELAQTLGFEAMALYRHVAGKDEIVDGILDLVLAETEPAAPDADWADAIRRSAVSFHAALDRHPWAVQLLSSPAGLRPAHLTFMEALLERLDDAGLPEDEAYHAYHVLNAYIVGFSLWEVSHSFTAEEQTAVMEKLSGEVSLDDYPRLLKHRDQHFTEGPHRDVDAFAVGLDLMLDGLKDIQVRSTP